MCCQINTGFFKSTLFGELKQHLIHPLSHCVSATEWWMWGLKTLFQHTLVLLELPECLLIDTALAWHFYAIPSRLICLFFPSLRHSSSANESKLGPVLLGAFLLSYISSYLEISRALRRHSRPSSDLSTIDTVNTGSVTLSSASVWNSICLPILEKIYIKKRFFALFFPPWV